MPDDITKAMEEFNKRIKEGEASKKEVEATKPTFLFGTPSSLPKSAQQELEGMREEFEKIQKKASEKLGTPGNGLPADTSKLQVMDIASADPFNMNHRLDALPAKAASPSKGNSVG